MGYCQPATLTLSAFLQKDLMNILVFSTVFYPAIGGLENQTLILIKEFIKYGHRVKVITNQKQLAPLADIEIFDSPSFLKKIKLFMWCDAYYMPNISMKGVWLMFLKPFMSKKKKWIISHNDFYLSNNQSVAVKLKRFAIKFASSNISVSASVADYINTGSTVIYNCYDESVFKLYPEEKRVYDFVFLGRLVSQKGCDVLIKACSQLQEPFTLNIIGTGPEEQKLKEMVEACGLQQNITFLGALSGVKLAQTLNHHFTMIVPAAQNEGFGIVVLEGLACGCNIIASNAAGLVEAVDQFGAIFSMNNVDELAALLKTALQNKQPVLQLSPALQHYLNDHTRSAVSLRYLQQFEASSTGR